MFVMFAATATREVDAVAALRTHIEAHGLKDIATQPFATLSLSKSDAAAAKRILWDAHVAAIRAERTKEIEERVIAVGGARMPIWFTTFGEKPAGGRSLFISMHGGGGAPKQVNDQQWENQKRLYAPLEGIYLAPRAPSDAWDLWHQAPVDDCFDRLIEDLIVLEDVNPDRVYLMGYSAGGDGVFQLAPRMADRWAAVAMMAGHPNETKPDGLRNIGFTLHMGANDAAYDRNKVAERWKVMLDELSASDPTGYRHEVVIHAGKGHWMDREDAVAVPWMAKFTRDPLPTRIVWLQDDVTHARFYWLANDAPKAGDRVVVERTGQAVRIVESTNIAMLRIRLDDAMLDLDREVLVSAGDKELLRITPKRTIAMLATTLAERGDPRGMFASELSVRLR